MKKRTKETIVIGSGLVILSLALHYAHYLVFQDAHHTLIYLFADIAFIPMEVFFTTLVIDRLLEKREKDHLIEKLNMLVGVFFTEFGTKLLSNFVEGDNGVERLRELSQTGEKWDDDNFKKLLKKVNDNTYTIELDKVDMNKVNRLLGESRELLFSLITNESLHDHETFTEMLMALMHLKGEIEARYNEGMEEYEKEHLEKDMAIAYKYVTIEYCHYMNYLSKNYPSLFCNALINNPFDNRSKKERDVCYLKIKN